MNEWMDGWMDGWINEFKMQKEIEDMRYNTTPPPHQELVVPYKLPEVDDTCVCYYRKNTE